MDIRDIQNLIKFVSKADVAEVSLEIEDVKIKIKTLHGATAHQNIAAQPYYVPQTAPAIPTVPVTAAPAAEVVTAEKTEDSKFITIKSPMIGTFYRSAGPGKDAFVSEGSTISKGSVLCIVEAMKLFNEIESEVSGKIVKILVDDSTPVEFDQPLFLVDPS